MAIELNIALRLPEVERASGLKRSRIAQLEALGKFPRRIKLSERAVAWRASDIAAWLESRRPAKAA